MQMDLDRPNKKRHMEVQMEAPTYKPGKLAVLFFAHLYFYDGRQEGADDYEQYRINLFGDETVLEVFKRYESKEELLDKFAGVVNNVWGKVLPYWNLSRESIESKLNGRIFARGGKDEIELIKNGYVKLPILQSVFQKVLGTDDRTSKIVYVLGSSGSGKTFFAVKDIAEKPFFENVEQNTVQKKSMTFYLRATELPVQEGVPFIIPENLGEQIKACINDQLDDQKIIGKVDMRLSLVIDEAGSPAFNGYFEQFSNLEYIYSKIYEIAAYCQLIIVGTGLTAENVNSQSEAKKYRMMHWGPHDIHKIIKRFFGDVGNSENLKRAIYSQPTIKALTTNGRSAHFVVQAAHALFGAKGSEINDFVLHEHAPYIVHVVVNRYIEANGINSLDPPERRLVACMVFEALNKSSSDKLYIPKFEVFGDMQKSVALSMIDINIDIVSGCRQRANETLPSVMVSPAIAIILYSMFGLTADLISTWRGHEQMCALYACRQKILKCLNDCREVYPLKKELMKVNLKKELMKVKMVKMHCRIPEANAKNNISIPLLNTSTVWINGDKAPFADVVAPFCLYQCKHSEKDVLRIDWITEFDKCGLLKTSETDRATTGLIVTTVLMKIWQDEYWQNKLKIYESNDLSLKSNNDQDQEQKSNNDQEQEQKSKNHLDVYGHHSYPEILIRGEAAIEPQHFIEVAYDDKKRKCFIIDGTLQQEHVLDSELSKGIEFIFYCNTASIIIFVGKKKLSITKLQLNKDGTVDEKKIKKENWSFFKELVNADVTIRFLLD